MDIVRSAQLHAANHRLGVVGIEAQVGQVQHHVEGRFHLYPGDMHAHAGVGAEAEAESRTHGALNPQVVGTLVFIGVAVGGGDAE